MLSGYMAALKLIRGQVQFLVNSAKTFCHIDWIQHVPLRLSHWTDSSHWSYSPVQTAEDEFE